MLADNTRDGHANATAAASSLKETNLHREQRRLDDLVFQSSTRLAHSARKAQKARDTTFLSVENRTEVEGPILSGEVSRF